MNGESSSWAMPCVLNFVEETTNVDHNVRAAISIAISDTENGSRASRIARAAAQDTRKQIITLYQYSRVLVTSDQTRTTKLLTKRHVA